MRVVVLAYGSRGDVQPMVALGVGLRQAGHRVRILTHEQFRSLVERCALDFAQVGVDPKAVLAGPDGQSWLESSENPIKFALRLRRVIGPLLPPLLAETWAASRGAELIVCAAPAMIGSTVAEATGACVVQTAFCPWGRTRAFPTVNWPPSWSFGGPFNLVTHHAADLIIYQFFRPALAAWRASLGLAPYPPTGPVRRVLRERVLTLQAYSPAVVPPPDDWPSWCPMTGYWTVGHPEDWRPPADLTDFLADGPPPVYVGFGSMTPHDPAQLTELVLDAIKRAGRRAVLATGWGGLGADELRSHHNVYFLDEVPHAWLFPRMAAIVHHGGAGTTAAGLRAGVPNILVPFFGDQPFWAHRVSVLGVGPRAIPKRRLTASGLAKAIGIATHDDAMRRRAADHSVGLCAERGVENAVRLIHQYLDEAPVAPM